MAVFPEGLAAPPSDLPGVPVIVPLAKGTRLWRVHSSSYLPTQFNPIAPKSPYRGGRFDSESDGDPFLYAGDSREGAIAEVWDRDLGPDAIARLIPLATLEKRLLSELRVQTELLVINVSAPAASQFGQSSWLTKSSPHEYPYTRHWAGWLRRVAPPHCGFVWRSKRDEERLSYVFFERQLPEGGPPFKTMRKLELQSGPGRRLVEQVMRAHNAAFG